ncbi:MAG TPA: helix-turn-helix domain-containing protein [Acidimicrobiales bacterium]|nr:helix-turn-helix domain-containing protein [Acidimicrobiales bacterium]
MMDRLLLRPEEAAHVLAVGRNKVFELLAAGELESVRVGGSRRIPAVCLVEFVERLRQTDQRSPDGASRAFDHGGATPGVAR